MKVKIHTADGVFPVTSHGMFTVNVAGEDVLFCVTDNFDGTCLEATEYMTGLRWPTALMLKVDPNQTHRFSPAEQVPLIEMLVRADLNYRNPDESLKTIHGMRKRYKTNELDF